MSPNSRKHDADDLMRDRGVERPGTSREHGPGSRHGLVGPGQCEREQSVAPVAGPPLACAPISLDISARRRLRQAVLANSRTRDAGRAGLPRICGYQGACRVLRLTDRPERQAAAGAALPGARAPRRGAGRWVRYSTRSFKPCTTRSPVQGIFIEVAYAPNGRPDYMYEAGLLLASSEGAHDRCWTHCRPGSRTPARTSSPMTNAPGALHRESSRGRPSDGSAGARPDRRAAWR